MLETERLILREWRDADLAALAALNADPEVMRHFPAPLDLAGTEALLVRMRDAWARDGFGFAVVERRSDGATLGLAGLSRPGFEAPFMPCVEVGWRLARAAWGQGYASEAARAWLAHGFDTLGLSEIVSFTATTNTRSQAVMRRIGMQRDMAGDFQHPALPDGHRLRAHVLYRMSRARRIYDQDSLRLG